MGKASLDKAIAGTTDKYDIRVKWSPFFLRPNMPKEGVRCGAQRPDGTKAPNGPYWHYAIDRARSLGIDMSGGVGGNKFPNTTLAHVLLSWAYKQNPTRQHELAELIFEAFYSKEVFLGLDALIGLAARCGYSADKARSWLESTKGEAAVKAEARKSGVSGVPFFIINGEGVFSGAQDPQTFEQAFAKAARDRPLPARMPSVIDAPTLEAMSPKELKQLLLERGANPMAVRKYVEKSELVHAMMEQQQASLSALPAKSLRALLAQQPSLQSHVGVEKEDLVQVLLQGEQPLGFCTPDGKCY